MDKSARRAIVKRFEAIALRLRALVALLPNLDLDEHALVCNGAVVSVALDRPAFNFAPLVDWLCDDLGFCCEAERWDAPLSSFFVACAATRLACTPRVLYCTHATFDVLYLYDAGVNPDRQAVLDNILSRVELALGLRRGVHRKRVPAQALNREHACGVDLVVGELVVCSAYDTRDYLGYVHNVKVPELAGEARAAAHYVSSIELCFHACIGAVANDGDDDDDDAAVLSRWIALDARPDMLGALADDILAMRSFISDAQPGALDLALRDKLASAWAELPLVHYPHLHAWRLRLCVLKSPILD